MSHINASFYTLASSWKGAADIRIQSKAHGYKSGFTSGEKASRVSQRIRTTVRTIQTPFGAEFPAENKLYLLVLQGPLIRPDLPIQ